MTIAATLATAPLIAFHFGELSTTTLVANLLALPAVAPAMWLGMLAAAAGQLPGFPLEALNWLGALLLAYVAQVASWCGDPDWAQLEVKLDKAGLVAAYAALVLIAAVIWRLPAARRVAAVRGAVAVPVALVAVALLLGGKRSTAAPPDGLRVEVLDVGQGDAILLRAGSAPAVLVDGGPSGDRLAEALAAAGLGRLGAAVVTHDQSDHAGGIEAVLGRVPVERLVYAQARPSLLGTARRYGAIPTRALAGGVLEAGALRLEVLWPPRELLAGAREGNPNQRALVLLARWRHFSMLLAADAEAEAVPLDPGPIDVLKVAHHGSEDAGLAGLLERIQPRLSVISVGDDNPYGHPSPATLATLAAHGVRTLRTDRDGGVTLEIDRDSIEVTTEP